MKETSKDDEKRRQIYGGPSVLAKARADEKFAYVVALARSVNALTAAHSLMVRTGNDDAPAAKRDRMNSYFFSSAILYEILKLIKSMGAVYGTEKIFQDTLQLLLKDKLVQELEKEHLKPARRDAVFHYLPDPFAEAIATTGMTDCVFASMGETIGNIHYEFADYIAAEMEVGGRLDDKEVVVAMMQNKLALVKQFINHCETFIEDQLEPWGFRVRDTPDNQPRG
jgi:hypothetical protein